MFTFHMAEFRRCSTQTRVQALHERKGRSGWKRQRLHKLASLPKRLSSNCAWTLKHRCEEMGGDPDRASASRQSFNDMKTKVCTYKCTWPHWTSTIHEQICLQKTTSASCDRHLLTKMPATSQYIQELEISVPRFLPTQSLWRGWYQWKRQDCVCPGISNSITVTHLMLARSSTLARHSRSASYHGHTGGNRNTRKCSQMSFPWNTLLHPL